MGIPKFFYSSGSTLGLIKKFYKKVQIEYDPTPNNFFHQYIIKLDGRAIKSPNRNIIKLPTYEMAYMIAHEFSKQEDYIRSYTMPLVTKTAIDLDFDENLRAFFTQSVLAYFENDTICYQENEKKKLGLLQMELLSPIRNYINKYLDINVKVNYDLATNELNETEKGKLIKFLDGKNNWSLIALENLSASMKSTSLGISLLNDHISVEKAFECSRIEEDYQSKLFGKVEGEHDLIETLNLLVISSGKVFYDLLKEKKN